MPSHHKAGRSRLGDSWDSLNSSDADSEDGNPGPKAPAPAQTSSKRPVRRSSNAPHAASEPQLIMPSVNGSAPDGSRIRSTALETNRPRKKEKSSAVPMYSTATSHENGYRSTTDPKMSTERRSETGSSNTIDVLTNSAASIGLWLLEILGGALKALKKPLTWLLTLYLLAGLFSLLQNLVFNSITAALSPICRIPGASLLNLPICHPPTSNPTIDPSAPAEFDKLITVQSHFEDLMEGNEKSLSLPYEMKISETSVRDLRQVLIYSTLRSKNELLLEIDGFIETSRIASYDLQKWNSRVGRAVDSILATARWTERVLDDMALKQSSSTNGIIPSFISETLLRPFKPLSFTHQTLLDQYVIHTNAISNEIATLLSTAQSLLSVLQSLEDRLEAISSISTRDGVHAQTDKEEILSHLWTQLGGNRSKLGKFDKQLQLLKQVTLQRRVAWTHVSTAILKLQEMGAQLDELRERVGGAENLIDHPEVPLAVHLEQVRLGVERLEAGRENAREVESGYLKKRLDGDRQKAEIGYALEA